MAISFNYELDKKTAQGVGKFVGYIHDIVVA